MRDQIAYWKSGKKPTEQGYTIEGKSFTVSELKTFRSFADLQNKGVPQNVCLAARNAGYSPSELSEYLHDIMKKAP